ncbi:MAG: endonuclease/exonuclease/phosphatase family protein [Gemmatimonadota bacterium]|nr:endonuclease/exonuclease/phosphatase family protein [Gemmatimonadota bacterium]
MATARRRTLHAAAAALLLVTCGGEPEPAGEAGGGGGARTVRVALFNVQEMSTAKLMDVDDKGEGQDPQLRAAAAILQRIRPDVLVLEEIDHDYDGAEHGLDLNARRFVQAYLTRGEAPLDFRYTWAAPNNTGLLSGLDLNGDGIVATEKDLRTRAHGDDSFGYGEYPGQYSMAVLSRLPLLPDRARTFARFRWQSLPGHHMPVGFYAEAAREALRLSSKSHWDLPVQVADTVLHLLVSHPTPPVFDGEEDRNGRRNFDEIRFWALYLDDAPELEDDAGRQGGYDSDAPFVVVGDLNARPNADESLYDGRTAISQLLEHPRIQDTGDLLISEGGRRGRPAGPPDHWERATTGFGGGSRIDYLLPSIGIEVLDGGVFWPDAASDPEGAAWADAASDHRLIWLDLRLP